MFDTPQSAPRSTGWTIHVALLLYNDLKPDKIRQPVEFGVSSASPTTETNGLSKTFQRNLAHLESEYQHGSVSRQLLIADNNNNSTSNAVNSENEKRQEEMNRERKEEKLKISSFFDKKSNEEIALGHDSTIFDLKEAISQKCRIADIYTDSFALVFERQTLPDWPTLRPKTLNELGLFDQALVYAVEFDKEQYNLQETLATRLVSQSKEQRRKRLESAFSISQDCMDAAKGFSTLVDESVFPPVSKITPYHSNRRAITSSHLSQRPRPAKTNHHQSAFSEDLNASELKVSDIFFDTTTAAAKNKREQLNQQRPSTTSSSYFVSSLSPPRGLSSAMTNLEMPSVSPRTRNYQNLQNSQSSATPMSVSMSSYQRAGENENNSSTQGDDGEYKWNPGSDSLFRKKYGFRGEERERRYREYEASPVDARRPTRAVTDDWLVGKATSDIE